MRRALLIPIVALAAACSATPAEPTASAPSASEAVAVSVLDFMLEPSSLDVTGPMVTFDVTNDGPTPHNFSVRDDAGDVVLATADLSVGEMETISGELEPGEYTTFCSLPGHESLGMTGTLTVGDGS